MYALRPWVRCRVISGGGQVSVPAEVRHRWGARALLAGDPGGELVPPPAPDDPVAAVRGIFAAEVSDRGTTDELLAGARAERAAREASRVAPR